MTVTLFATGIAVCRALDGRGPGFLHRPEEVVLHTLFGRFYDFACGIYAANVFAWWKWPWRSAPARRRAGIAGTLGATLLILASMAAMHEAGGIEGDHWAAAWTWELLLAPATALLILSLTEGNNPIARCLGIRPLVYLGKVSYALYLIQLTPLGKGLFYKLLPGMKAGPHCCSCTLG